MKFFKLVNSAFGPWERALYKCLIIIIISIIISIGLQPRDKVAMLGVKTMEFVLEELHENGEFSSQRREMLLFLTTNMAAVTSRANQQCSQRFHKITSSCRSSVDSLLDATPWQNALRMSTKFNIRLAFYFRSSI